MTTRPDYFMKPDMLRSQFATLEEPTPSEAICLPVTWEVPALVATIIG